MIENYRIQKKKLKKNIPFQMNSTTTVLQNHELLKDAMLKCKTKPFSIHKFSTIILLLVHGVYFDSWILMTAYTYAHFAWTFSMDMMYTTSLNRHTLPPHNYWESLNVYLLQRDLSLQTSRSPSLIKNMYTHWSSYLKAEAIRLFR